MKTMFITISGLMYSNNNDLISSRKKIQDTLNDFLQHTEGNYRQQVKVIINTSICADDNLVVVELRPQGGFSSSDLVKNNDFKYLIIDTLKNRAVCEPMIIFSHSPWTDITPAPREKEEKHAD